jgi:hypothetical protein
LGRIDDREDAVNTKADADTWHLRFPRKHADEVVVPTLRSVVIIEERETPQTCHRQQRILNICQRMIMYKSY